MNTKEKTGKRTIANQVARLEQRCEKLSKERRKLVSDLKKITAERDQYLRSLYKLMRKEIDFDPDELLKQVGKGPSIHELIDEIET